MKSNRLNYSERNRLLFIKIGIKFEIGIYIRLQFLLQFSKLFVTKNPSKSLIVCETSEQG